IKSVCGMRPSPDKLAAIRAGLSEEQQRDAYLYFLEFPLFHGRYTDLSKEDFGGKIPETYKGHYTAEGVTAFEQPDVEDVTACYPIEPKTEEYFRRTLALAGENDIPVLLVNVPYIITTDDKMVYNSLEQKLEEYGQLCRLEYLDLNQSYEELGLDFASDFADNDHLNKAGMTKLGTYLADYLAANYDLPDRR
ncbi:MAG: hypothetical protein J6P60_05020, partial [Lachnospiraceae bacterium]|nr:hypothetical protein [Lachnospiraceae bacterium]